MKLDTTHVGYKVRLFPTKKQVKIFYEYFGLNRFVYNKTIDLQEEQYMKYIIDDEERYKKLSFYTLCSNINKLKQEEEYSWLNNYNITSIRGAIMDCYNSYNLHEKNPKHYAKPKYKSKIYSKKQFYTRADRMSINSRYIKISSIGEVKYCNSYGDEILGDSDKSKNNSNYIHYANPRVSFDGANFYLSFTIPKDEKHQINSYWKYANNEEWQEKEESEAIGIDVGLRNDKWLVDSTGYTVTRPDNTSLNKKISRLQRKYQRQKNKKSSSYMEQHPNGSKNMQKTLIKINKCFKKISNRRKNTVYNYASRLLKFKPKAIVMETLSSIGMVSKNNNFNDMIIDAGLYESMMIIEKKMTNNGIRVIRADSDYPSSQICSCCGFRQNIGRKNIYRCPNCGTSINRDPNAAINLKNLAY